MAAILQHGDYTACSSSAQIMIYSESNSDKDIKLSIPKLKENPKKKVTENPAEDDNQPFGLIISMAFSPCNNYFAACNDKKELAIWAISNNWKIHNTRDLPRRPVKILFTKDSSQIIAADKTGDVYSFKTQDTADKGNLLFGHSSMLLDMVITDDNNYIISSDRDEKIRVSKFPNAYTIESYCLGHTEFVVSISLLSSNPDILISGSGDKTLRLWNFKHGKELLTISCEDVCSRFTNNNSEGSSSKNESKARKSSENKSSTTIKQVRTSNQGAVAVLFSRLTVISIYQVTVSEDCVNDIHLQDISFSCEPWDAIFDKTGRLLVLQPSQTKTLEIFEPVTLENKLQFKINVAENRLIEAVTRDWALFQESLKIKNDMDKLFKQWYDNVEQYLSKKEERLNKALPHCKKKRLS